MTPHQLFKMGCVLSLALLYLQSAQAKAIKAPKPIEIRTTPLSRVSATACFPVERIIVRGQHDLVESAKVSTTVTPLAGDCLDNAGIGAILKAVNGLYADAGYVTTQAYLPQQDVVGSKRLVLEVIPGRVGKVVYAEVRQSYQWFGLRMLGKLHELAGSASTGEFAARSVAWYDALDDEFDNIRLLAPGLRMRLAQTINEGDVLHVDSLQNTIDALNRVPSHKAAAELAAGKQPATSDIKVANQVTDSFRTYAGYDTESVEGIDRLRFGTTIEKDNLVGVNDIWSATLRGGTGTNEVSGNIQVPIRNWAIRGSADWQESTTELAGLAELYIATWNASGGADWNFQHNKSSSSNLDVTLSHREQDRYINGAALEDQRVTALSVGLSHSRSFERGSVSGRVGATLGLPLLNARRDEDNAGDGVPRNQYSKLDLSISGKYVIPGRASLSSALTAQWTNDVLFQGDQLTIGSRSSVRGFSNASFSADTGTVLRNEIALAIPVGTLVESKSPPPEWVTSTLSNLNPYAFLDAGAGRDNANHIDAYRLSAGLAVRYGGPRVSYDVGYGFRLAQDDRTPTDDAGGEAFLNLRLKLF